MVAKEKTAVSLTYKPTTKPQNHEQPNLNPKPIPNHQLVPLLAGKQPRSH
jgi:hypothetical protein